MSDFIIVYSTFPSKEEAKKCAQILVEERLCACANILGDIESIYMWEGSIDCSPEVAILFKTINANYEILEKRIKEIHPFKIPCIISIPINKGLDQYLGWLSDSLKQN